MKLTFSRFFIALPCALAVMALCAVESPGAGYVPQNVCMSWDPNPEGGTFICVTNQSCYMSACRNQAGAWGICCGTSAGCMWPYPTPTFPPPPEWTTCDFQFNGSWVLYLMDLGMNECTTWGQTEDPNSCGHCANYTEVDGGFGAQLCYELHSCTPTRLQIYDPEDCPYYCNDRFIRWGYIGKCITFQCEQQVPYFCNVPGAIYTTCP